MKQSTGAAHLLGPWGPILGHIRAAPLPLVRLLGRLGAPPAPVAPISSAVHGPPKHHPSLKKINSTGLQAPLPGKPPTGAPSASYSGAHC